MMGLPALSPHLDLDPLQFPTSLPSTADGWTQLAIAFDRDGQGQTFLDLIELLLQHEHHSNQW